MNQFLKAAKDLTKTHGTDGTFSVVTEGVYNDETLTTINTQTDYTVRLFKNHVKTSQYHYPNLVGKEIAEFYLANNSIGFTPNVRDLITYSGQTFTVENIQEHHAQGELVLYLLVASKG